MKTPKRNYISLGGDVYDCITARKANKFARWKRKNRIKQLKRTIERLEKDSIDNYLHGYNAGLQHGIEIGFLQGSKKLSEDILFQKKENQQ